MKGAKRILVVEDDPDLAKMVDRILRHDGYEVRVSANGDQALDLLDAEAFDLLITDLMMPGMEGEELLTRLRARGGDPIPTILISASARRAEVAERLAVDVSLAKPFDTEELRQLVGTFFDV